MEFLNEAFAALDTGVDTIMLAVKPLLVAYGIWIVAQARTQILSGVPAILRGAVASLIELALQPLVNNAVRSAEEYGNRIAKSAIDNAKTAVNRVKLEVARAYIRKLVPDSLASDETVDRWIDAGLVRLGIGATKAVQLGVEVVETQLRAVPPPAFPPAA